MKKSIFGGILLVTLFSSNPATGQEIYSPDETLWFTYPATNWSEQTLHIGNGHIGASFYGGVEKECIDIAEKTFWTGGPHVSTGYNSGNKPGGKEMIGLIREKIVNHQFAQADSLCRLYMTGDFSNYGYFSTVGNLEINFRHSQEPVTDLCAGT